MADIIDLATRREPHSTGTAFCLGCDHEWVAVAPVSRDPDRRFECPACRRMMGRYKFEFGPEDDALFTCNCGNQLFLVTGEHHLFCPRCGARTNIVDLFERPK